MAIASPFTVEFVTKLIVTDFLSDMCSTSPAYVVHRHRIYSDYVRYCRDCGAGPLTRPRFIREIRERIPGVDTIRGYRGRGHRVRLLAGIALKRDLAAA